MIRTNLSTRPFYNERLVHAWIGLIALVVAAATIYNVSRALYDLRSDTELKAQAARDEARAAELGAEAARLRESVDVSQVATASVEARRANEMIDRRTFSWTELLSRFESTLPPEVRITAVQPTIERDRRIALDIAVVGRDVDDVDQFMRNMEKTGAFADLLSREERVNEQGQLEASIDALYLPPRVNASTSSAPSPASLP